MNDEALLLQMREQPDDLDLRQILADWLEERGDPRGELLRLSHALTHTLDFPGRPALEARLRQLVAEGVAPVGPYWTNSLGMAFAWVPPGTFLRGSPREEVDRQANETRHRVTLTRGFYLGVGLVTQGQWEAVLGTNPSRFVGADRPVEGVSWDDCHEFCKVLTQKDHLEAGYLPPYRLPTEAEWEYACRAGTMAPFYFGATLSPTQANFHSNYAHGPEGRYREETTPVGTFPVNAWGLTDLHGNLFEWCADGLAPYPEGEVTDPWVQPTSDIRVLRGGSWHSLVSRCRSACRGWAAKDYRGSDVGVRICFRLDYHQFSI